MICLNSVKSENGKFEISISYPQNYCVENKAFGYHGNKYGRLFFGLTRTFQNLAYERLPHLIHNFPESFTMFQRHENPNLTLFVDWIGETYNFRER